MSTVGSPGPTTVPPWAAGPRRVVPRRSPPGRRADRRHTAGGMASAPGEELDFADRTVLASGRPVDQRDLKLDLGDVLGRQGDLLRGGHVLEDDVVRK